MSTHRSPEQLALGMPRVVALCLLLAVVPAAHAADATGGETRDDIARQQRELTARFDAEERSCRAQFVVTACVDSVRSQRRAALAPLRDRELRLDEAQRRSQAETRRAAVAQKQRVLADRGVEPSAPAAQRASGPTPHSPWRAPQAAPRADTEAAAAGTRVQAAERRREQATAAQARIAKRQAEQLKKGKATAPLPDPSAASAPRR